jgi:RsiW-degrading membrane proteinase PrsW (M82 family)
MSEPIPELPRALTAPEPVIVVGMVGFLIATVLVAVWDLGTDNTLTICLVGLGVGLFGCFVVSLQRWAIRRGSRAAQDGLS